MSILRTIRYLAILGIVLFSFGCSEGEVSQQRREPNLVEPILGTQRVNLAKDFVRKKVGWRDPEIDTEGQIMRLSLFRPTPPKPDESKTYLTTEADERWVITHLRYGYTWIGHVHGLYQGTHQQFQAISEQELWDAIQAEYCFANEIEVPGIE